MRNKTVSFSFENGVVWTGSEWSDLKTVLFENAVS